MEPNIRPDFGSSYVHLHHNLVFLDPELCRVDAREFNDLYREGVRLENEGDDKGALDCFSRAADLYEGDFIPEETYDSQVLRRREDFKNIYIDLLTRLARRHTRAGASKKAVSCLKQAIETDPLLEEAYRDLMTLYAEKNLYNEALRVFEACRKVLKEEMDSSPDPLTMAIYRGIRDRAEQRFSQGQRSQIRNSKSEIRNKFK